ncbi:MAG: hypothetical protein WKF70_05155 [Chitinophagaceae bacterium]
MRFLLSFLLIALLAYIAGEYLPWWSVAIVAFLAAVAIPQSRLRSFLAGFTGIFLLWTALALWIDARNEGLLSGKIALLFPLGGSGILLIFITAFVGGLVGGFAALSGSSLRGLTRVAR